MHLQRAIILKEEYVNTDERYFSKILIVLTKLHYKFNIYEITKCNYIKTKIVETNYESGNTIPTKF